MVKKTSKKKNTCAPKQRAAKQVAKECRDLMRKANVAAVWLKIGEKLAGLRQTFREETPNAKPEHYWRKTFDELKPQFGFGRVMADRYIRVHKYFTADTAVSAKVIAQLPASFKALLVIVQAKMTAEQIVHAIGIDAINPFSDSIQVRAYAESIDLLVVEDGESAGDEPAPAAKPASAANTNTTNGNATTVEADDGKADGGQADDSEADDADAEADDGEADDADAEADDREADDGEGDDAEAEPAPQTVAGRLIVLANKAIGAANDAKNLRDIDAGLVAVVRKAADAWTEMADHFGRQLDLEHEISNGERATNRHLAPESASAAA
jgi:hypothetical protein